MKIGSIVRLKYLGGNGVGKLLGYAVCNGTEYAKVLWAGNVNYSSYRVEHLELETDIKLLVKYHNKVG